MQKRRRKAKVRGRFPGLSVSSITHPEVSPVEQMAHAMRVHSNKAGLRSVVRYWVSVQVSESDGLK